jgi:alkylation response protein AidB-like acyl-CoA dehydrogenase
VPIDSWTRFDAAFSQVWKRGFIGMTWPIEFGGGGHSALDRYVVTEEFLAAGAPVGALISTGRVADRSSDSAPRPQQNCFRTWPLDEATAIGMSELEAGSDLAAIKTARNENGGWILHGRKVWTTRAPRPLPDRARPYGCSGTDRHAGFTQFIVDLKGPVSSCTDRDLAGAEEFSEVLLECTCFERWCWARLETAGRVDDELAAERSGPERFLSTFTLLVASLARLKADTASHSAPVVGRLIAHLATLRDVVSVAARIAAGGNPDLEAVVGKDGGTSFDREVPELARKIAPPASISTPYEDSLARAVLRAPSFSLRGGTREILRGIIARGLGLR